MELNYKIRALRLHYNLSQQYVADLLNICQKAYSKIETGDTVLTINRLEGIAKIFKIHLWELILVDFEVLIEKYNTNKISNNSIKTLSSFYYLIETYENKIRLLEDEINFLKKENQYLKTVHSKKKKIE
ncbi:MAG: helix-turn-helix transcriptional regulator [Vicingaceae bacterium]|nr:helix-turn-helix transcriptional regulator [Vicingaceae bacterium]